MLVALRTSSSTETWRAGAVLNYLAAPPRQHSSNALPPVQLVGCLCNRAINPQYRTAARTVARPLQSGIPTGD